MKAREFFEMVARSRRDCERLHEIVQEEEARAGSSAPRLGGVRSAGVSDPTARAYERIALYRARYEESLAMYGDLEQRAELALGKLASVDGERAVRMRYLEDMRAPAIARAMSCSLRSSYYLIDNALDWLDANGIIDWVLAADLQGGVALELRA